MLSSIALAGHNNVLSAKASAVVDTGASLILAPKDDADNIFAPYNPTIKTDEETGNYYYFIKCKSAAELNFPDLHISFEGDPAVYTVKGSDLIREQRFMMEVIGCSTQNLFEGSANAGKSISSLRLSFRAMLNGNLPNCR